MKIYGVALVGILTALGGLVGNARADTVIASKAYVDSKIADVATEALNTFTTTGSGNVVKSISESNGAITATLGNIGSADITDGTIAAADLADNAVTTAKIANLNVTTDKLAASAVTHAKLASDAVESSNIKDGTIANADISASAAVDYTKMNSGLSSVNTGTGDYSSSCVEGAPCILTFFIKNSTKYYRWTSLNPEGLTAL